MFNPQFAGWYVQVKYNKLGIPQFGTRKYRIKQVRPHAKRPRILVADCVDEYGSSAILRVASLTPIEKLRKELNQNAEKQAREDARKPLYGLDV